jgi:FKBP-type peptidyl-prolyl cis-trans isomerase SlpA
LSDTLERCLLGLIVGEQREFTLSPADAFGEHNPRLVEWIARSALPPEVELKENSLIEFSAPNGGGFAGFCRELTPERALFDFNHPLAGKTVTFAVHIIGVM